MTLLENHVTVSSRNAGHDKQRDVYRLTSLTGLELVGLYATFECDEKRFLLPT